MDCKLTTRESGYRLLFEPVIDGGPAIAFPCNADGAVDLDALDDDQRAAYFGARILRRLHHVPRVIPVGRASP
jgi:hypothetical protein